MALIKIIFSKIVKNKWLYSCLLVGLIITVALVSSIPLYTQGILNRLLLKDLENSQISSGKYPGTYSVTYTADDSGISSTIKAIQDDKSSIFSNDKIMQYFRDRLSTFKSLKYYMEDKAEKNIQLPVMARNAMYSTDSMVLTSEGTDNTSGREDYAYLQSLSSIDSHITLTDGRMPSKSISDGAYEVMVTEAALNTHKLQLNHVYIMSSTVQGGFDPVKVKPVGVFKVKDTGDPYWIDSDPSAYFSDSFVINEAVMLQNFVNKSPTMIKKARWNFIMDYQAITIDKLSGIVSGFNKITRDTGNIYGKLDSYNPSMDIINNYFNKESQLRTMLMAINIPVILMLSLYMFMICRLIINREKNEIALLNSRGANRRQIVTLYLIQGLLLSAIAILTGPLLGLLLSKVLGASSGFLQFVDRKAVSTHLSGDVYMYSLLVVLGFLIILFVPVFNISKVSIVEHKRSVSRKRMKSFWEKIYLDVILIAVSAYGYYSFMQRQSLIKASGASASDLSVDPLLFFIPPLFIVGTFLLFLRIYPYIVKFIFRIGRKRWSPGAYSTLLQVGRAGGNYHFLMLFLTMTISVGIFSAASARTININSEEKIQYKNGADIVLTSSWNSNSTSGSPEASKQSDAAVTEPQYSEPDYQPYTELSGVSHAAKVFTKNGIYVTGPNSETVKNVQLMGVNPYDFGNTLWFRDDLLPYNINGYLNLLSSAPTGCVISTSLSKSSGIKAGDTITMNWSGVPDTTFSVMAVVDYWPSFNPVSSEGNNKQEPMLVVANLPYIQNHMALEPYQVWLKLKPGATTKEIYDSIAQKKLPVVNVVNTKEDLTDIITSPFMLAVNGALTLGFVVCGIICFMGFLLYWILEMNSRRLQYGIFSAIGLKVKNLVYMILAEQLLTSGIAIAGGVIIGFITSKIFVPFFQASFSASDQVPTFRVVINVGDITEIFILVGISLLIVFFILSYFVSTLKINQAIKLGEE